ncbi:MAG: acetyltransferase [Balneola sp.]
MSKQVIIGYSGHSFVVLDAAEKAGFEIFGYTEKHKQAKNPFKLEYIGFEGNSNFEGWDNGFEFVLGIGDNKIREGITELLTLKRQSLLTVIHPSSNVGSKVEFGAGTFVAAGTSINPMVKIGKAVILNTGVIIEHECKIGNSVHVAPGAVLAGNVKVGDRSFIGANAVVKEGVEIGSDVIVGAAAVVLDNVQNGSKIVGNPGRII